MIKLNNSEIQRVLEIAQAIAKEHTQLVYSPAHILQGLMHNEIGLAATLATWQKDVHYIREWADLRIEKTPKSGTVTESPAMDTDARKVLEIADMERIKLGLDLISPEALLAAICRPNVAFTADQLKSLPLTEEEILKNSINGKSVDLNTTTNNQNGISPLSLNGNSGSALAKYCIDKTAMARDEKLDPIIGRDKEIRIMTEILGRRIKPNPIILGDPGVGKTALVDGFAQLIVSGQVPESLKNAVLLELDSGSLIAGASYKGEIEDRIKKIVAEIKTHEKAILFIDEIHMLLDPNAGFGGAANLLKPELARGELTVIGATTIKEYREFIENDPAFSRRFDKVIVDEPDVQSAIRMVQHLAGKYEEHHNLKLGIATAAESVTLAKRYVSDKSLPDSAFDLIDGTMSAIHMMTETSIDEIDQLMEEIRDMNDANIEDYQWLEVQMNNRLSPILIGKIANKEEVELTTTEQYQSWLLETLGLLKMEASESNTVVEPSDVAAIIANKTNIPIGKLQENQRDKYLNIEDKLRQRVVGQDGALKVVSEAILESRAGLKHAGKPVGSFFFTGPTGTGKTELAKSLASFLFNDETALIRFDMSEFKESVSAALLYGASPGYVGYKEGGLLVNKIREKPYSIVLFDEIEKAHESVFDVFLQILDEGRLTDKQGRQGDFSNAVILFTSNLGQNHIVKYLEDKKHLPSSDEIREIYLNDPSVNFRPEFLGRMDAIVPFAPISEEVVQLIFNIQLKNLVKLLHKQGIAFEITEEAEKKIAFEGYSPKFGARPIRNVIKKRLRQPLSRLIIEQKLKEGEKVTVDVSEADIDFKISKIN